MNEPPPEGPEKDHENRWEYQHGPQAGNPELGGPFDVGTFPPLGRLPGLDLPSDPSEELRGSWTGLELIQLDRALRFEPLESRNVSRLFRSLFHGRNLSIPFFNRS